MLLLTPGPVSTRPEVKQAMTSDIAPWDRDFGVLCQGLREKLLACAGVAGDTHAALPLQGCGHFGMEAVLRSFVPAATGRLLVPLTGAYAVRLARLAREAGRQVVELVIPQHTSIAPADVAASLANDSAITHVGLVYSETSTGVIHDLEGVADVVRAAGRTLLVDAVSAFGALPVPLAARPEIAAAVFTSNKCLEGMPGLSVTIARLDAVRAAHPAGSWSFDFSDALRHQQSHGAASFRFTPPAQVVAALDVALDLHRLEGGVPARLARYRANAATLYDGMQAIGLVPHLPRAEQGPIVTNIHAPDDPAWSLQGFVDALKRHGFVISNFFDTPTPTFRVGCIGAVAPADISRFVQATDSALAELGVRNRAPAEPARAG